MIRSRLPDVRRDHIAVVVVLIILIGGGPLGSALAATLSHSASSGTTYVTNDGLQVQLTDDREVEAVPFDGDETFSDGNLTVSAPGNGEIGVGNGAYSGSEITVTDVDATTAISVNRSDLNQSFTVESGDAATLQVRNYTLDNNTADIAYSSQNGFDITLTGLPSRGIAAVDAGSGDVLDTVVVGTTEDTATFSLPSGTKNIELQSVPSELQVRNEANPDELVDDNVTLRARFFAGQDTVIERSVTNGTVSLDGLPPNEEVIVTVKESNANFTYRRILLESIVETQEIYLLPTDVPSAEVRFSIEDQTNRFDADNTRFFVEKPITRNNNTEYRVIAGDRLGADGEFPTILVDSERYRLRVENAAGEQRILGSYTVQGASTARIPIGDVEFAADVEEGAALQTSLREAPQGASHNYEARIVYLDPEGETSTIDVGVEYVNGTQIRPTTTEDLNGTTSAYVETYPLPQSFDPEQDTAVVKVDAERGFETETFEGRIGDVADVFDGAPLDPFILELMGYVSLIALVGLLVIVNPPLAALVGSGYAGVLSLTGVAPIPMPAVVLAGVVSVLANVGTSRGVLS